MPKRLKSESCTPGWCRNHIFELGPLEKGLILKKKERMRLCPHFNSLNKFSKSIPVFNNDKKFYTPTFILEEQHTYLLQNEERLHYRHMEKVLNKQLEKSQMEFTYFMRIITQLVARQSANKIYCGVCQQAFQDYLDHINLQKHKKNIHKNKFTGYIKEMEGKYKKLNRKESKDNIRIRTQVCEESQSVVMMNECQPSRTDLFSKIQLPSLFN